MILCMKRSWDASAVAAPPSALGEGPWWDDERGRLLWVDIAGGRVRTYAPDVDHAGAAAIGPEPAFVVGRKGGGYVVGTAEGLLALDGELRPLGILDRPPDLDGGRRINDGACDQRGRIVFGTIDPAGLRTGSLWSWSPERPLAQLADGVQLSNGLAFSADGRRLYYVDSPSQRIDVFAYDHERGVASDRRTFFRVPREAGLPDGLAADRDGGIWTALWGAREVWRIAPDGRHVGTVRVPTPNTTSCAFGGAMRDRLYITTAQADDAPGEHEAGRLFVADVATQGAPVWKAAGLTGG
jgi:sugar lactone lactonase YvrE